MGKGTAKTSRPVSSFLLGAAGLAMVLLAHAAGLDRRAELHALDARLRITAPAEPAEEIVHVDIDDRSLEELGRWPWPRRRLAGVIDLLAECGATRVVLDVILPEPQTVRYLSAAAEVYGGEPSALLQDVPPTPVYDDLILTETLRRAGNVFLPFHVDFHIPEPTASQKAMDDLLAGRLAKNPRTSLSEIRRALTAERSKPFSTEEDELLAKAYLRRRGQLALARFALPARAVRNLPLRSGWIIPPLAPLARACAGSGFVTFEPDLDGAVRRIPLLCQSAEGNFGQFALAVAAATLAADHGGACDMQAKAGQVSLRCPDGEKRRIPVDDEGYMLIRWTHPGADVRHISAAGVGGLWVARQRIEANLRRRRILQLQIAQTLNDTKLLAMFAQADRLCARRVSARKHRYAAMLYDPARVPPPPETLLAKEQAVEERIDGAFSALEKELDEFYLARRPDDTEGQAVYDRLIAWRDALKAIAESNRDLKSLIAEDAAQLRSMVAGRTCLIGSTSTGAADFVPTPLGPRTPGVVVHANIAETILAGEFLRVAPAWANWLAIVVCGLAVSAVAAWRPAVQAGLLSAAMAAAYIAGNVWGAFAGGGVWLIVVAPVAAMTASFLLVTVYRQLTEERAKRRIRGMFAHALSEPLVARIEEDPSILQLGGQQRSITCMFSDIAGFTPLAERLGPEETVRLLNRYFDRVTDTVQNRRGGYLNKFLGDGIFAFFGAPVFQDDHPRRAIQAALDCQEHIRQLNEELSAEGNGPVHLAVRIGLSTGQAMVGNCGSSQRMDYTAIGDCVNLAARLEAANKYFGTDILATNVTYHGEEGVLARPLGRVLVTGQSEPVAVWNLLVRAEEATDAQRRAVETFTRGQREFEQQRFEQARRSFGEVRQHLPHDRPSEVYVELCDLCLRQPEAIERAGYETHSGKGVDQILWPWAP